MKRLLLLIALAVCAPALHAQEVKETPPKLAQIDPAARDLLARTAARYRKFESFESLITWEIGEAGKGKNAKPRHFRVKMTRFRQFVVGAEFPDKSWKKWIYNGATLISFDSKFPKTYVRQTVRLPFGLRDYYGLEAVLGTLDAEGPLLSLMLTHDFGAGLLSPDFAGLGMSDDGNFQVVEMLLRAPKDHARAGDVGLVKLWIDPQTLTLDHVTALEDGVELFTESYAQTRFNPKFDPAIFRAAAPLDYKLVSYFPR